MKKITVYKMAQIAVVNSPLISPENKIEILKVLFEDEKFELYVEKQNAEKAGEQE